jgi:hypothetical protein
MAKENFFKRFIDSFRGGSEGDLEDRVDTPPEELEETPVEEAKPFMASPLAGVANMIESRFIARERDLESIQQKRGPLPSPFGKNTNHID